MKYEGSLMETFFCVKYQTLCLNEINDGNKFYYIRCNPINTTFVKKQKKKKQRAIPASQSQLKPR